MLSLKLLGPPALWRGAQPVRLTIRKTWCLLVLLACAGAAPRARLAASLWPALDEATARRNLRRELARLREAGVPELLLAADDRLALDPAVRVDLADFEQALKAGDSAAALALWRGELADGLAAGEAPAFDGWLEAERHRVHGLWRAALQAAATQAAPAQALPHWQALLADDPLQEQHHQAVIGLHLAAGRREEALAQYQRCRSLLRDELGLATSAQTEALIATARETAPRPAAPVAGSSAAPPAPEPASAAWLPDPLPFIGRDAEVAAMEAAWRAGHTIVVEGEGGVGKTRLALDFAAAHGACALARCRSSDTGVPYASWTRVLRALAGPALTRASLAALPGWACDELARLVPELAGSGAPPAPMRSDEERSRFFEACAAGWQALCTDSFDAVLLDDWHLADAASSAVVAYVVQRGPGTATGTTAAVGGTRLIVLLRPAAEAAGAAQALRDAGHTLHLKLQPLPAQQVFELVRRLSGASDPARFAARLQAATEGNPFFLAQTLRHLAETGALTVGHDGRWQTPFDDDTHDYRELPMPATVRDAVLARVARLGAADGRVLEAAALAAEPFSPALLAPACAMSEVEVVLAIERAVLAGLLREHGSGGYAFAHDLVQQALDAALGPERRRLIHRRLALGAEAAAAPAAVIAAHHEASGEPRRAVPHRLAAAEQAQHLHALPEAMAHWRQALADGATPQQALQAHEGLMLGARMGCDFDTMLAHGDTLQALAAEGSGLAPEDRAAALCAVADNLAFGHRAEAALALLERMPAAPSSAAQARQATIRSHALHALGRLDEARAVCAAALALPGLPVAAHSDLLEALCAVEFSAGRTAALREQVGRLLQLAQTSGSEEMAARARLRSGISWLFDGDHARAQADLEQAAQSFAQRGSVYRQRIALYNLAMVHQAQSRHDSALAVVQHGWQLQPPLPEGDLRLFYRLAFVDTQVALGLWGPAWEHAQAALAYALAQGAAQPLCAACLPTLELLGLIGETALARRALERLTPAALQELQYMASEHWISVAQFELSQGDAAAAAAALALAPPAADIADVRVRARHALALAELRMAEGQPGAALTLLPAPDAEGMNDEMRIRSLALALRAQGAGGGWHPDTVATAVQALSAPAAFAPAILQLHRALAQALAQGLAGVPATLGPAHADFVAALAQSLHRHPAQQAAFLRPAG